MKALRARFGNGLGKTIVGGLIVIAGLVWYGSHELKRTAAEKSASGEAHLDTALARSMGGHHATHDSLAIALDLLREIVADLEGTP